VLVLLRVVSLPIECAQHLASRLQQLSLLGKAKGETVIIKTGGMRYAQLVEASAKLNGAIKELRTAEKIPRTIGHQIIAKGDLHVRFFPKNNRSR